jgi:hypothetical protein
MIKKVFLSNNNSTYYFSVRKIQRTALQPRTMILPKTFYGYFPKDELNEDIARYINMILSLIDRYCLDKRFVLTRFIGRGIIIRLSLLISELHPQLVTHKYEIRAIEPQFVDSSLSNFDIKFNINPDIDVSKKSRLKRRRIIKFLDVMRQRCDKFKALPRIPLGKVFNVWKIKEALHCRRKAGTSSKKVFQTLLDNYKLSYIPCPFADILMNDNPEQIARILNLIFRRKKNLGEVEKFNIFPFVTLSKVSDYEYKLTFDSNFVEMFNFLSSMTASFWFPDEYFQLDEQTTTFTVDSKKYLIDLVYMLRKIVLEVKKLVK